MDLLEDLEFGDMSQVLLPSCVLTDNNVAV